LNALSGLLLPLLLAQAAGPMVKVELKLPGRVTTIEAGDVNGDGQRDLLVFWRQGSPPKSRGRVSIYLAKAGRVNAKPVQILSLPPQTVAFDVGDADADGRTDVLLLMGNGVWSLAGQSDGKLAVEPVRLVDAMTMGAIPNEDHVPPMQLLVALDDEHRLALMVPTVPIGPLSLYLHQGSGRYELLAMLQVPTRANMYTSAEDFRSSRDYSSVFQVTMPRLQVTDQDGDGLLDLLFFDRDGLAVFRARADGGFPVRPDMARSFGLLTEDERLRRGTQIRGAAADFNGDGRADLVFNKASGGIANMKNEVRLFLADPTGDYPVRPKRVIRSEGYGAYIRATDLNGDGRVDLVRPYVKVGILSMSQVLLTGRIDIEFLLHLSKGGLPEERPAVRLESSLSVDFKGGQELSGPYPMFGRDYTGDGRSDVVIGVAGGGSGKNPDRLEIRAGLAERGYDSDAIWSVDLSGTRYVQVFSVRPDGPPGLLVYFPVVRGKKGDVWVFHNTGKW
jgi:hypothetical protein